MTNADTDIQELSNFLLDFATTLMGVGSHTSRVVRNVNRIAESFGYGVDMTIFQRNITMTVKTCRRLFYPAHLCKAYPGFGIEFQDDIRFELVELGSL